MLTRINTRRHVTALLFVLPALLSIVWMQGAPSKSLRMIAILVRCSILVVAAYVLLDKGIMPELLSSDVQQLYFPYFAEVRFQHSIWLDPTHPVIADFFAGRGNGVHLFFT